MRESREWQPAQYGRFRDERTRPFHDLARTIRRRPGMRVVDLGCGTGELTRWLHVELAADSTLGVDRSPAMLAEAAGYTTPGLRFIQEDIERFAQRARGETFDLVFSNAALQWIDDHERLMPVLAGLVGPGGQIAVQVPANDGHASHRVARETARRFADELGGYVRPDPVREPAWYADALERLGFPEVRAHYTEYVHELEETRSVVEWVKGSLLTPYRERLPSQEYERFLAEYEHGLIATLGERRPYTYRFRRLFLWAQR